MLGSNRKKRFFTGILTFLFLTSCLLSFNLAAPANSVASPGGGRVVAAEGLGEKAVQYIHEQYLDGVEIDAYTAYVLTLAGEDLAGIKEDNKWVKEEQSLKKQIIEQARLLGNENNLITYLCAVQNENGSFGPMANDYGTRVPLQALALVKDELEKEYGSEAATLTVLPLIQQSIESAAAYYQRRYLNGSLTYTVDGFDFDYRCVEALVDAGVDLETWVYAGETLLEKVLASATAADLETAQNPKARGVVSLAKEIIALNAVAPDVPLVPSLTEALLAQQEINGDALVFGESVYEQALVLTALGKVGQLKALDQEKAFNYFETFKTVHQDIWGAPCGVAWGGYYPEEADLTAQILTALSYFTDAKKPNTRVGQAIKEGLAYLADIQEEETGAIPAPWDNTFSTAETLIALKAQGKTYSEYAGTSSWVKKSPTKTIAQTLLALNQWHLQALGAAQAKEVEELKVQVDRLANLLIDRHTAQSFENSVYSDIWAYLALGEAGKLDRVVSEASAYLLAKQHLEGDLAGSWGETFETYYPDFMSTAQALRVMADLAEHVPADNEINAAIALGLTYLKKQQQPDGSIYITEPFPEDPVVDTAEVLITLFKLEQDPLTWKSTQGNTPGSYLLTEALNADGSFGPCQNVLGATEALYAFHLLGRTELTPGTRPPSGSSSSATSSEIQIAIVGREGELLYRAGTINLQADQQGSLTALGALAATGLNYVEKQGLVTSIAGQANAGMQGWMYQVNGQAPTTSAVNYRLQPGDQIIWWYSTDPDAQGPTWRQIQDSKGGPKPGVAPPTGGVSLLLKEQNLALPAPLRATEAALVAMGQTEVLFVGAKSKPVAALKEKERAVVVVGDTSFARAAQKELRQRIFLQPLNLREKFAPEIGLIMKSDQDEISLVLPGSAFDREIEISLEKEVDTRLGSPQNEDPSLRIPPGFQPVSPLYQGKPEAINFTQPVTLNLRLGLPWFALPDNLVLAQYDRKQGQWMALPAVYDQAQGLILVRLEQLSPWMVLVREEKSSFADVTESAFGWAQAPIEKLAGAGIIAGVDGKYFVPEREITRAEMAALLVKALGLEEKATSLKASFLDVMPGAWYAPAVNTAVSAGLIQGYDDHTFQPDRVISRQELAVLLVRCLARPVNEAELDFVDKEEIAPWAQNSVAFAVEQGLLTGFPDHTYRAQAFSNRAEAAVMAYRLLTYMETFDV